MLTRRNFFGAVPALALTPWAHRAAGEARLPKLYVLPMGPALPDDDVRMVQRALSHFYELDIRVMDRVVLPKAAYYPPRKRYRAEKLLPFLEASLPGDGKRILGITSSDISTTKGTYPDWGILGLANVSGSACVLSSFRCRRGARSPEHARQRFGKVAVHELGHTFGLSHCRNSGCLMQDGRGSVRTVDEEQDLCSACRLELVRLGVGLANDSGTPW